MSEQIQCPKCSSYLYIADKYDETKIRVSGKSCTCLPFDGNPQTWPEDCQSMQERINELERWMNFFVKGIPYNTDLDQKPTPYSVSPQYMDLNPSTRFMDCVRNEVIDRALSNGINKAAANTVWLRLCIFCGNVETDRIAPKNDPSDPDMEIGNNTKCWRCKDIMDDHPQLFEWVTKIIQWRFKVDAWTPKRTSIEQVRVEPPPPPPPPPQKSIIV